MKATLAYQLQQSMRLPGDIAMRYLVSISLCALLTFSVTLANGAEEQTTTVTRVELDDEAAIRKAISTYLEAFNRGDSKAVAAHWNENGSFQTAAGDTLVGRAALETHFSAYFAEAKQAKLELLDTNIELLSPHVAQETGIARIVSTDIEPSDTAYQAIHIKTAAGWKIDSVREQSPIDPPPSHYAELKSLEWMLGSWINSGDQGTVTGRCRWTKNQNFLVNTFQAYDGEQVDFEGTLVIGWDPNAQTIRSWLFDSDGGFGVGRWTNAGNRWTVQTLNILPDGRRGSSTNVYEVAEDGSFQFSSVGRQVDGELLPSIEPVLMIRQLSAENLQAQP